MIVLFSKDEFAKQLEVAAPSLEVFSNLFEISVATLVSSILNEEAVLGAWLEDGVPINYCCFQTRAKETGVRSFVVAGINGATNSEKTDAKRFADECERWALEYNCNEVRIIGRKGFEKMFKPEGFSVAHVTLVRKIKSAPDLVADPVPKLMEGD